MSSIEKLITSTNNATTSATNLKNNQNRYVCANPLRQLHSDTISFQSKGKYEYIDENDTSLFKDCVFHPIKSFDDLSFDNIVLVHKTDYFPENGTIKTLKNSVKDENGNSESRSTIHFSLNYPVKSHKFGNWDDKRYVILAPLKSTIENQDRDNFLGGMPHDFVFSGNVELPSDSVIIKYNNEIPNGKLRISKDETTGLKLVESSNKNLSSASRNIIKKMGFVDFKDLVEKSNATGEDILNGWNEFCNKNNYTISLAQYLPHHRADSLFHVLYFLSMQDDWYYENELTGDIDYKSELTKIIDEIKEATPKDKPLSYDIDKLRDIIEQSETPKEAYENVKNEFKIAACRLSLLTKKEIKHKLKNDLIDGMIEMMRNIYSTTNISIPNREFYEEFFGEEEMDQCLKSYINKEVERLIGLSKDRIAEFGTIDILSEYMD